MDIEIENLDLKRLREDLINYFGPASTIFPAIGGELIYASTCNAIELINLAINYGFDLEDYVIKTLQ